MQYWSEIPYCYRNCSPIRVVTRNDASSIFFSLFLSPPSIILRNAQVHDQIHNHRLIVARKSIEQKFHSIIYFFFFFLPFVAIVVRSNYYKRKSCWVKSVREGVRGKSVINCFQIVVRTFFCYLALCLLLFFLFWGNNARKGKGWIQTLPLTMNKVNFYEKVCPMCINLVLLLIKV